MIKKLLELAGVEPERFNLKWCSSAEAQRFVDIVTGMIGTIKELGPLGSGRSSGEALKKNLTAARDAISGERLRWLLGKEYNLETSANTFGEKFTEEKYREMLDVSVRDEFYKSRILNLTREKTLSVKDMAPELGLDAAEVLRLVTMLRGRNIVDVKEVKGTSPLYTALV